MICVHHHFACCVMLDIGYICMPKYHWKSLRGHPINVRLHCWTLNGPKGLKPPCLSFSYWPLTCSRLLPLESQMIHEKKERLSGTTYSNVRYMHASCGDISLARHISQLCYSPFFDFSETRLVSMLTSCYMWSSLLSPCLKSRTNIHIMK